MSDEVKGEILKAWNRYMVTRERQYVRNEGSSAQNDDYRRLFKEGIVNHEKLSKKEKTDLLSQLGFSLPTA